MSIETWAGRSQFNYTGCIAIGTEISFGSDNNVTVTAQQYLTLRNTFIGQVVKVGTSFDKPQEGSIGEWLLSNVTLTAIASMLLRF